MAGHSKWANIQHRKGRQDAVRSKLFSKISKEITVAAKMGDPDVDKNPRLRLAVKEARSNSVPKDVIERAIKKSLMYPKILLSITNRLNVPVDLIKFINHISNLILLYI